LKNNPAKFHPDPTWNHGALGFLKSVTPNKKKHKNEKNNKVLIWDQFLIQKYDVRRFATILLVNRGDIIYHMNYRNKTLHCATCNRPLVLFIFCHNYNTVKRTVYMTWISLTKDMALTLWLGDRSGKKYRCNNSIIPKSFGDQRNHE